MVTQIGEKDPYTGQNNIASQGDAYDGLRQADPYASIEVEHTLWDRMQNFFGFRSGADKREYELEQLSNEYQAGIEQQKFENAYNSEVEKAKRMRSAGMNPDLLGTSGVSSASTHDAQHNPSQSIPGMSTGQDVATGLFNLAGMASNLCSSFFGMRGQYLNNAKSLMDVINSAHTFGRDYIENTLTEDFYLDKHHYGKMLGRNHPILSDAITSGMDAVVDFVGDTPQYSEKLSEVREQRKLNKVRNRFERATIEGSKYYSGEMETMKAIAGILFDAQKDAEKHRDEFNSDYYGSLEGDVIAGAENAEARTRGSESEYRYDVTSVSKDLAKTLKKQSDNGNMFSTFMLILMQMAGGVTGSITKTPKGITKSIGF